VQVLLNVLHNPHSLPEWFVMIRAGEDIAPYV